MSFSVLSQGLDSENSPPLQWRVSDGIRSRAIGTVERLADGFTGCGKTTVAPASRRLSRGNLAVAHRRGEGRAFRRPRRDAAYSPANPALKAPRYFQPSLRDFTKPLSRKSLQGMFITWFYETAS